MTLARTEKLSTGRTITVGSFGPCAVNPDREVGNGTRTVA